MKTHCSHCLLWLQPCWWHQKGPLGIHPSKHKSGLLSDSCVTAWDGKNKEGAAHICVGAAVCFQESAKRRVCAGPSSWRYRLSLFGCWGPHCEQVPFILQMCTWLFPPKLRKWKIQYLKSGHPLWGSSAWNALLACHHHANALSALLFWTRAWKPGRPNPAAWPLAFPLLSREVQEIPADGSQTSVLPLARCQTLCSPGNQARYI